MPSKAPPPSQTDKEQDARLDALESTVNTLTTRVTALEGRMTIAEQQIADLEAAGPPTPITSQITPLGGTTRLGEPWSTPPSLVDRITPLRGIIQFGEPASDPPISMLVLTLLSGQLRLGGQRVPVTVQRRPVRGLIEIGL
jgi:hypothetical protein